MYRVFAVCLFLLNTQVLAEPRLVVNTGHTDDVTSVVLSSDRKRALTASMDQTARIWDVAEGKELLRLSDHDDWVNSAVFSPDDAFVVTGTEDSRINLYSVEDGRLLREISAGGDYILSVAYTPDGENVISADGNGDVTVWSADDLRELRRFSTGMDITAMALTPSGKEALVGSFDGRLVGVSLADGTVLQDFEGREGFPGHTESITSIATFKDITDDLAIASASEDNTVILWHALSGEPVFRLSRETASDWPAGDVPTAIAFSPDFRQFAVGHKSGRLRTIDTYENKQREIGVAHRNARINGVAFSADSASVITGAERGEAKLWRVEDGKTLSQFLGRVDSVEAIDVRPDGRALAAGSGYLDKEVSGWSLVSGINLGRLAGQSSVRSLQFFTRDQGWLAYTFDQPASAINLWNDTTEEEFDIPICQARSDARCPFDDDSAALAFSPDGRYLLAFSEAHAAMWNVETRQRVAGPEGSFALPIGGGEIIEEYSYRDEDGNLITEEVIYELGRASAAWSPDGRLVAMGISNDLREPNPETNLVHLRMVNPGEWVEAFDAVEDGVNSLQFSPDGKALLAASNGSASIIDLDSGKEKRLDHAGAVLNKAIWLPDGRHVVTGGRDRVVRVWEVAGATRVREFKGHTSAINDLRTLKGGDIIVSASKDGTIRLWDNVNGGELGQLVSFGRAGASRGDGISRRGGEWAVIDRFGRFDASNGGDVDGLHWIVDGEVVALSQLKERYYEPGLLAKLLGFNVEPPRDVGRFADAGIELFPVVNIDHAPDRDDPLLRFTVTNKGGGIGPVQVLINGKEVVRDARPAGSAPQAPSLSISMDLADNPLFVPGEENDIEIVTSNTDESLRGRGKITVARGAAPISNKVPPLSIWTVAVGVSDYRGTQIDLQFADKDAKSFADAMAIAAEGLAPSRSHVTLLNGDPLRADRATLVKTIEDIAGKASSTDILVVYLAGHGVTTSGPDPDYYYLLQDASSLDIRDRAVRDQEAISSKDLTALINEVHTNKQVLILDTCAAGQLISDMVTSRGVPSAQMRSIDKMKDRTGMFILAGSAADAVSYETTRFGQGLLTYSILDGMRGRGLNAQGDVDVSLLFGHALDQVETLAKGLGGIQQPRISSPERGTFYIGHLPPDKRGKIKVSTPKPVVISSMFQDQQEIRDHLRLGARIDRALREAAESGKSYFVFFSADHYPDAYTLAGRYVVDGEDIRVTVVMSRGDKSVERFAVTGSTTNLEALERDMIREMETRLHQAARQ